MAALLNDGNLYYGSFVAALSSSAGVAKGLYVADEFVVARPTTALERKDELGCPNGEVIIPQWVTATGTLQLASTASAMPELGDLFSHVFTGSAETFVISEVTDTYNAEALRKVSLQFRKKVNV